MRTPPFLSFALFVILVTACGTAAQPNFDYDRRADLGLFRPGENRWYVRSSESGASSTVGWGLPTDRLVPADYDGDGLTDISVWRPETGVWYVLRSRDGMMQTVTWGTRQFIPNGWISDEPVPGDYDGDGVTDFAVWRPGSGVWYILISTMGFNPTFAEIRQWGKLADIPVADDYDGDGRTDLAVYRYTENRWYARASSNGAWITAVFGQPGVDRLVPGDYTGDGRADFGVYRNGTWVIQNAANGQRFSIAFGLESDTPVPADYDGDGRIDPAVYRNGRWYVYSDRSAAGFETLDFGTPGDIPIASLRVRPSIVPVP